MNSREHEHAALMDIARLMRANQVSLGRQDQAREYDQSEQRGKRESNEPAHGTSPG
jgi:hypothetical protein